MPEEHLPSCPGTGKVSFHSKLAANKQHRWRVRNNAKKAIVWLEPYRCTFCPYWHLTKGRNKNKRKKL